MALVAGGASLLFLRGRMNKRRLSAKKRIINALKAAQVAGSPTGDGWMTNLELNQICHRYSARICELRKEGHDIEKMPIAPGVNRYRYRGFEEAGQIELFDARPYDN